MLCNTDLDTFDSAVIRQLTNFHPVMTLAPCILHSVLSQWRVAEIPSSCYNRTPMDCPLNCYKQEMHAAIIAV